MEKITVVKVGGAVVEDEAQLMQLLKDFAAIEGNKVLVHGGGRSATKIAAQLGIETKMVNGRRITDREMLNVVTMVYGGLVNKNLVAKLQAVGVNALGLTGADIDMIRSHKRPLKDGVDFGYVGDVDANKIDTLFLEQLLGRGMVPVFCAITHNSNGTLLNTNADTMASAIAVAMTKDFNVDLIYCFEKDGVLYDKNDDSSVIPLITSKEYRTLLQEKIIADGMIPKMDNAFNALNNGVNRVIIKNAENLLNDKENILKLYN